MLRWVGDQLNSFLSVLYALCVFICNKKHIG